MHYRVRWLGDDEAGGREIAVPQEVWMPSITSHRSGPDYRPAWADVDLDAIRHNAAVLVKQAGPARLMAVVKADGYGHGAVAAAFAALEAGATWLGVALVEEG